MSLDNAVIQYTQDYGHEFHFQDTAYLPFDLQTSLWIKQLSKLGHTEPKVI